MAQLERRGKRWRVKWYTAGRGSKVCVATFRTKPEAETKKREIERVLAATAPLQPHRSLPWDELVDRYCLAIAKTSKPHRDKVASTLKRLATDRGWKTAADVDMATTENLLPYHARVLRAVLNYAIGLRQRVDPLVIRQRRPKGPRTQAVPLMTDEQITGYLARAAKWSDADGALAHIIARYGHRAESLVNLTVGAFDPASPALRMRVKSGDTVLRPITAETAALLAPLAKGRKPTDPLFVSHLGRPWASGKEFAGWWMHSVVGKDGAGKYIRGHGIVPMRKRATTILYRACKDAKAVAEIQGRRTPALVLQIYAQTDDATMRSALAAAFPQPSPSVIPGHTSGECKSS